MSDSEDVQASSMDNTQIVEALGKLSPEQLREALSPAIGRPTKVNGLYWLVLGTACFVMILCVLRLTGTFILLYPNQGQEFWSLFPDEDKITGIFTTVLSFVVGLFVPSPVSGQGPADAGRSS